MYERIFEKYMKANPDNIMYFEGAQMPDTLPITSKGLVFDLGFEKPPGGEINSKNHVLNDNTYCC